VKKGNWTLRPAARNTTSGGPYRASCAAGHDQPRQPGETFDSSALNGAEPSPRPRSPRAHERQRTEAVAARRSRSAQEARRIAKLRQQLAISGAASTEWYPDVARMRADNRELTRQRRKHAAVRWLGATHRAITPAPGRIVAESTPKLRALKAEESYRSGRPMRLRAARRERRPKSQQEFTGDVRATRRDRTG